MEWDSIEAEYEDGTKEIIGRIAVTPDKRLVIIETNENIKGNKNE
jgi:hypothetical protein